MEIQTELLQPNITIEYLPHGSDMPYRIIVGNNPVNAVDPRGLAGFAFDVGGAYGTGSIPDNGIVSQSGAAGTGFYIGARDPMNYGEIGGYVYQSRGKMEESAKIGLGCNLTYYKTDAEKFFKGK